ncbi:hypothetical protein [Chachezhania sediminis]|uniref:hypothetical protein n=1 Tax=Chachezhania sediminis TaxID=2599291 RepID=UPI00131DF5BF|nr:hypothetical protein [Chachezhania sediminis]
MPMRPTLPLWPGPDTRARLAAVAIGIAALFTLADMLSHRHVIAVMAAITRFNMMRPSIARRKRPRCLPRSSPLSNRQAFEWRTIQMPQE